MMTRARSSDRRLARTVWVGRGRSDGGRRRSWLEAIARSLPAAIAAPAAGILGERLLEGRAGEDGPELVAEDELGVGRLPQEVVGEPLLAAGADDQVGVVHL